MNEQGLKFIQSWEGCILHPYKDSGGTPTSGWGMTYYPTTGIKVEMTDNALTQEQADAMFVLMVKPFYEGVLEATGSVLNPNQMDACTSFAYNCGLGAFKDSLLLAHIKEHSVVETDFTQYDHVGLTVNAGLLKRRQSEYNLFITPMVEPLSTNTNTKMITYVKFFNSATHIVVTLFTENYVVQNDGMTFDFADAAEAVAKSETNTFIFWDNLPISAGTVNPDAGLA